MGRKKGSENHKGEKPWVKYGLTKSAYYQRMRRGIPFDAKLTRGRKKDKELAEALETFGKPPRTSHWGGGILEENMRTRRRKSRS